MNFKLIFSIVSTTFLFGSGLCSGTAFAHGVEVSKPDANTICKTGQDCAIQWTLKDVKEVHLKIRLSGTKEWIPVAENIKNTENYKWTVAKNVQPGTYKVLVLSTKDEEVHGVSPEFQIVGK